MYQYVGRHVTLVDYIKQRRGPRVYLSHAFTKNVGSNFVKNENHLIIGDTILGASKLTTSQPLDKG